MVYFSYHNGTYYKYYGKNNGLISSLLKEFAIFELHISYKEGNLDVVSIKCINCKRETGLFLKINSLVFDDIIIKFVLNAILHHVGMSWIFSSSKEMKYEMDKNNLKDWLNKGPWVQQIHIFKVAWKYVSLLQ